MNICCHCHGIMLGDRCPKCCWPERRENHLMLGRSLPPETDPLKTCRYCGEEFVDKSKLHTLEFCPDIAKKCKAKYKYEQEIKKARLNGPG